VAEPRKIAGYSRLYVRIATLFSFGLQKIQLSPFIRDVLFTSITSVITTLSAVVVTRLLAEGLGPEKFGAYSLSRRMLATIAPFSMLGMNLAITRYVAISQDNRTRGSYFLSGLLLGASPSLLILVIGLVFKNPLSFLIFQDETYASLFSATLLLVVGYTLYLVLYAFYRGSGRMSRANLWQIGVIGVGPVAIAWGLAKSGQVDVIVLLLAVLFFCAVVPLGYYVNMIFRRDSPLELAHSARELLAYGLPRVPAGLALAGMMAIGPFLASHVGALKDAGYLAAGQSVLLLVEGGVMAFGLVALPKVAQLATEGQREFLQDRISDVIAFTLHLGLFATLHIVLWADQVVLILLGSLYGEAIPIMRIILVALIPYLAYVLLRSVIDAIEKRAVNTINLFLSFIVILISASFLVRLGFGVRGLALATTIGFLTLGALTIRYLWINYQLKGSALKLKITLLLNISFIVVALIFKYWLAQDFGGLTLAGAAVGVEGLLFALFILLLWKIKVRWLIELEKRVIRYAP
jgi:O-antigen/teichoic acid export membrane protein